MEARHERDVNLLCEVPDMSSKMGEPPRDRYPLVVFLVDALCLTGDNAANMSEELANTIVSILLHVCFS